MKKTIILFLFTLLTAINLKAEGVWGWGIRYPRGDEGTSEYQGFHPLLAYGDSIMIFNGEYVRNTDNYYFLYYTLDAGKTVNRDIDFKENGYFKGEEMNIYDYRLSTLDFFPPKTLQFVHFTTGNILKSYDWGKTWTKTSSGVISKPTKKIGVKTFALDSLRQVFNSWNNDSLTYWIRKSYVTYDGWKTFDTINLPGVSTRAYIVNDTRLLCQGTGIVYYSDNRGKTWDSVVVPGIKLDSLTRTFGGEFNIRPNCSTILMTGGRINNYTNYGNIVTWKSDDTGKSWRIVLDTKDSIFYGGGKMSMNDKGVGVVVSRDRDYNSKSSVSYITTDYGETWERKNIGGALNSCYSCVAGSLNNIWALVENNVFHYNPGTSSLEEEGILSSSDKVYPNPVRKGATVYLHLQEPINPGSKVSIYSLLGELIDEYIPNESTNLLSYKPDEKLVKGNYYFVIETPEGKINKSFIVE